MPQTNQVYIRINYDSGTPAQVTGITVEDAAGKLLSGHVDGDQSIQSGGFLQIFFKQGINRPPDKIATGDIYLIPQTNSEKTRRESPFQPPEAPVVFIEDPGWGASDPANEQGNVPMRSGAIFAGAVPIRSHPGTYPNVFKYAVFVRGDKARAISGIDPTIKIEP